MGQALYRKYRSKSFDDVVGQVHITKTLQNAIKTGRISHAYLFTGPRGVGKTSVARILAHEVNALEYKDEPIHLDIIEIDAASNRRIDEIRDLRDKVRIAPAMARYKVYIIDEVHMLTREAFNALLKTLEEPPAHCIFILATTEAHKLPETITSRTQRFEFRPVNKLEIAKHLSSIAKREKIEIDNDALELLAEFGNGSFRDSISYLDQLSSLGKPIKQTDVQSLLGLPPAGEIAKLLSILGTGDTAKLLGKLKDIEQKGVNAPAVAAGLSVRLRELALSNRIENWQTGLLQKLLEVSAAARPQEVLEITLLGVSTQQSGLRPQPKAPPLEQKPQASAKAAPIKSAVTVAKMNVDTKDFTSEPIDFDLSLWEEVVQRSKSQAASIYTALRLANPVYSDGTLVLNFQFPLHQKKLDQTRSKHLVAQLVQEVSGAKINVEAVVNKQHRATKPAAVADSHTPVSTISNIFGNAEVLEA